MYSPEIVARRERALFLQSPPAGVLQPQLVFPDRRLPRYSVADCRAWTDRLGDEPRPLINEEKRFVYGEGLLCQIDAVHFLERYCMIDQEGHGLIPIYPLWESQQFMLDRLARLEVQRVEERSPDGLLLNILKIRQVGITTLGVALVCHRIFTQPYIRALVGSDIESQAGYLFRIAERLFRHLPWWLAPDQTGYNKNRELMLATGSELRTAWGKSTRGALQEVGGKKGNIERGRTYSTFHISELATWDNPDQLDSALLPGIPVYRDTLGLLESTAELSDDWWHKHWQASARTVGRFRNLFIAAYAVPSKYSLAPPDRWEPLETTKAWVEKAERESPQWCLGQTIHPTLAQQYWYETTRAFYEAKNKLSAFLKEYP